MTKAIVDIATPLGVSVHAHIIVGKNGHASLKLIWPGNAAGSAISTQQNRYSKLPNHSEILAL
jgi:hypothetical protein